MAKKRKTRDQKKLADLRHNFKHAYTFVESRSAQEKPQIAEKFENLTATVSVNAYPYLKKDLSKTALLTLGILIFQLVLFTILKNHIFVIKGLTY
jgi:hypothetical protein